MANFLGFKQVSLSTYNGLTDDAKKHYLWLVRDVVSGETQSAAIYFGTRLYAQMNAVDGNLTEIVNNIIASLGSAIDANGEFLGWLSVGNEILSAATSVSNALELLQEAILDNQSNLLDLEGRVDVIASGLTSVAADLAELADNVYDKSEIDAKIEELEEKISGMWHFKGVVDTVADLPDDAEEGDVYQVRENNSEYAWNGEEWIELGSIVDLTNYFTKAETLSAITDAVAAEAEAREEAIAAEAQAREELEDVVDEIDETLEGEIVRVTDIEGRLTLTANTYDEASALTMDLGQIVYILNGEIGESGHTAGAYINTQAGLKKLEATNGDGSDVEDRVEALENKVGTTPLPEGETITSAVADLLADQTHVITGNDVEE